jgi:indole-3-glycerol phosphate synthase
MVEYLNRARELDLACLVEVHSEEELHRGLTTDACIIGINNRDLSTMQVDLSTSLRLRRLIPPGIVTVSESGIQGREDVRRLEEVGFDAVLAGESLMSSPDIGAKLRELRGA